MAYCKRCGAYIPDGRTKCLACGYDESEQINHGGAAAAQREHEKKHKTGAAGVSSGEMRRELERQRQRRQEENRRWAEEERARRQAEQQEKENNYNREYTGQQSGKGMSEGSQKLLAALSYFSILFFLPYILCKDSFFARFHAKQGLALFVFGAIADVIGAIFPIGWLLTLFRVYCVIKGLLSALDGKMEPLPILGKYIKYE